MSKALRYFLKHHKLALFSATAALTLMVFFGVKFTLNFIYFNDPAHRNEALKPWMTPHYVGMSYQLPPHIINQIMQLEPNGKRRLTVAEIATQQGITLDTLEARIRSAAQDMQQDRQRHDKARNDEAPLMDALIPADKEGEAPQ